MRGVFFSKVAKRRLSGEFADYGVRIDKQLVAFIEAERVATSPHPALPLALLPARR